MYFFREDCKLRSLLYKLTLKYSAIINIILKYDKLILLLFLVIISFNYKQ